MAREDHERTTANIGTQSQDITVQRGPNEQAQRQTVDWAKSVMPRPTTVREALHLVRGDYTHGHPGLPPKDYKSPPDWKRR